ncbi:hypothetical protein ACEQPO_12080 [Bacillus sp. SL00103]
MRSKRLDLHDTVVDFKKAETAIQSILDQRLVFKSINCNQHTSKVPTGTHILMVYHHAAVFWWRLLAVKYLDET